MASYLLILGSLPELTQCFVGGYEILAYIDWPSSVTALKSLGKWVGESASPSFD